MNRIELKIHTWPDKILKKKCKKVEHMNANIRALLAQMYILMKENQGVGLAANQAGIDLSLVVIEAEDKVFKLVNPQIAKKEGEAEYEEGCLSFPGLTLKVKRAKRVWVSSWNEEGEPLDIEVEGILAIIFQHEIDHINGITFIDRIPLWRRVRVISRLKELKNKNGLPPKR